MYGLEQQQIPRQALEMFTKALAVVYEDAKSRAGRLMPAPVAPLPGMKQSAPRRFIIMWNLVYYGLKRRICPNA